jgi:hypothetical protein
MADVPTKRIVYKGLTLHAGAFEIPPLGRFVSTLYIERNPGAPGGLARFFDPPCPEALFPDARQALASAIAFGRSMVDDGIPGLTMDYPKTC